jgi:hypothetical protein
MLWYCLTGLIHSVLFILFPQFSGLHKFLVCTLCVFVYTEVSVYKNRVWCRFKTRITICIQDTITFWFIRMRCRFRTHVSAICVVSFPVETQVSVRILLAHHHHHFVKNNIICNTITWHNSEYHYNNTLNMTLFQHMRCN